MVEQHNENESYEQFSETLKKNSEAGWKDRLEGSLGVGPDGELNIVQPGQGKSETKIVKVDGEEVPEAADANPDEPETLEDFWDYDDIFGLE